MSHFKAVIDYRNAVVHRTPWIQADYGIEIQFSTSRIDDFINRMISSLDNHLPSVPTNSVIGFISTSYVDSVYANTDNSISQSNEARTNFGFY